MDWFEFGKEAGKVILGSLGGFGLVRAFGGGWISHVFDRRMKLYESELEKITHEQKVKISRIDHQRAEAIKKIYSEIMKLDSVYLINQKKIKIDVEKENFINCSFDAFSKIESQTLKVGENIQEHSIYFNSETYEKLRMFSLFIFSYLRDLALLLEVPTYKKSYDIDLIGEICIDSLNKRWNDEIYKVRSDLTSEFRRILGAE